MLCVVDVNVCRLGRRAGRHHQRGGVRSAGQRARIPWQLRIRHYRHHLPLVLPRHLVSHRHQHVHRCHSRELLAGNCRYRLFYLTILVDL